MKKLPYAILITDLQKKWWAISPDNSSAGRAAEGCGGRNIATNLKLNETTTTVEVGAEWVLSNDPDYIFMDFMGGDLNGPRMTEDEVKNNLDRLIDESADEGFSNFTAVKNGHVCVLNGDFTGPRWVVGHVCIAMWLHPDLLEDLDPEQINKEFLKDFLGVVLDGTWFYPVPK